MGYDIADYKAIDPLYGTLEDVDELISQLKKRGMKLMMDLVVNHTSEQACLYFRDWYIWKPPKIAPDGTREPPNNWSQILGDANSAWTYDKTTDQYYLSLFTPNQPDLNWENPEVRDAVHDVMNFWLDRGACGFRMDVINLISKDQRFPDADPSGDPDSRYHSGEKYYINGPRMHEFLRDIHRKVLSKYDAITVGEMPGISEIDEVLRSVGSKAGELNMIFIFDIVNIDSVPGETKYSIADWKVSDLRRIQNKWQRAMIEKDGWNSIFVENHDNPRSVSRYTDDSDATRTYGAKLLAIMQTTLSGTLYVFQGEEIGMRNVPWSWDASEFKDIESVNFWKKAQAFFKDDPEKLKYARKCLWAKARDHSRTPMQWSSDAHAGFCQSGIKPWMRVNDDYETFNAEVEMAAPKLESEYKFWQHCLAFRKAHQDVFVYGDFQLIGEVEDKSSVFAYTRKGESGEAYLIVLNFGSEEVKWVVPKNVDLEGWVLSSYDGELRAGGNEVTLRGWEGLLGVCK
ncbi:MAG: hypothetical protein MMC33_004487 [Icmadophila ericetorum]|nr:hypothetical protein [Icmadophila ericetorum]